MKARLPSIRWADYKTHHAPIVFRCVVHTGVTWKATPYAMSKVRYGCPQCEKDGVSKQKRKTHFEFTKDLQKVSPTLKVLGRYRGSATPLKVRCLECLHVWRPRPGNLLNNKSGCPECYKNKPNPALTGPKHKVVSLGKRNVKVQGYEDRVIRKMLSTGVSPKDISVFSEGKIPVIKYSVDGKEKSYWPDLKVKDTLVEVKSTWTLFKFWKANVAKAKACVKQGHKLKVVVGTESKLAVLPENWFKLKEKEVQQILARKYVKSLRILAFDPGVTNFAWAFLEVTRPFDVKVVESGMFNNTVKVFDDDLQISIQDFTSEMVDLFNRFKPEQFIMERFMARGMKGGTIELVNIMMGAFLSWLVERQFSFKNRFKLIPASQWKNEWNRNSDLDAFYKKTNTVPHQVDAVGIGLYGAYYWFKDKPFENIKKLERSLAKQINATNQGHTIKRKGGK